MQGLPKMSQIGGLFFEHDQVNHDLSVLCQWLRANKITLKYQQNRNHNFLTKEEANITKHLNFRINGQKINNCSNVKYLGIMLEENLEWNLHVNLLKSTQNIAIGLLCKFRQYVPKFLLKTLYSGFPIGDENMGPLQI